MSAFAFILPVLVVLLIIASLVYTILHNRHLNEANLLQTVHAMISNMHYMDAANTDVLKIVFETDDHKKMTFLVDDQAIDHPALHQDGMLTYQGKKFKNFV